MLVYGDAESVEAPAAKIARVGTLLADAEAATGIERHGLLVAALIESGELAQGLADHAFAAAGRVDVRSPAAEAAMALTLELAREVAESWQRLSLPCHGRARPGHPDRRGVPAASAVVDDQRAGPEPARDNNRDGRVEPGHDNGIMEARVALDALAARPDLPAEITAKQPEGFAHYAVYPEAYLEAARALPGISRVIGIRSIGTTLAAMLAAARGLPAPMAVRPVGHPFLRELAVHPDLAAALADEAGAVAVADEGPGFSGSSFASVALWLESRGVPLERIHFVPSHGGEPGPQADPEVRRVWASVSRQVRTFDDVVLGASDPAHRLESWVADLIGEPEGGLLDISAGGWRRHRPDLAEVPVLGWQEKRKLLLTTDTGTWLLKFAGLGRVGLAKLDRARALSEAGFTPPVAGWRHGFLVERWIEDAQPLRSAPSNLAAYLGFRARHFAVEPGRGASTDRLFQMARHNIAEALGDAAAVRLDPWRPKLDRLERHRRPVETDNRLHAWEWLVADGRILKADALDHYAGHDLIGPQDIAWDVAGAAVEFGLCEGERADLAAAIERAGAVSVDPDLVAFCLPCYAAFWLGYYAMAAGGEGDPEEKRRLTTARNRYRAALDSLLTPL